MEWGVTAGVTELLFTLHTQLKARFLTHYVGVAMLRDSNVSEGVDAWAACPAHLPRRDVGAEQHSDEKCQ